MEKILDKCIRKIYAHVEEQHPKEACGLVVRTNGSFEVVASKNLSDDPFRSFQLDPHLAAIHHARAVCIYHSHNSNCALPSEHDEEGCYRSKIPYLIVAWPSGQIRPISLPDDRDMKLGTPFLYGFHDCFDMVRRYFRAKEGITLPQVTRQRWGWWESEENDVILDTARHLGFKEVEPMQAHQAGDVAVMRTLGGRVVNHLGVLTEKNMMLHQSLLRISSEVNYNDYYRTITTQVLRYGR
jgi:proteasome lid subunit RPN8/RPN11